MSDTGDDPELRQLNERSQGVSENRSYAMKVDIASKNMSICNMSIISELPLGHFSAGLEYGSD